MIYGRVVIFPFSVQCQHLDGCDCCHPDVVSLSIVVVAAASRANKLPRHYCSLVTRHLCTLQCDVLAILLVMWPVVLIDVTFVKRMNERTNFISKQVS